ncbi:hypothetical protein [Actinobacillus porcinus]
MAGLSVEDAKKLIEKAHEACPCSNAGVINKANEKTKGNLNLSWF